MTGPLICSSCGRNRTWMLRYNTSERIICPRCAGAPDAHHREFPACTESWHDGYDHDARMVTAVTK